MEIHTFKKEFAQRQFLIGNKHNDTAVYHQCSVSPDGSCDPFISNENGVL